MSNAYIIKNGDIVCSLDTDLENGTVVRYAFDKSKEELDANREYNLVNEKTGKISRAKKYDEYRYEVASMGLIATEINEKEFYIENINQEED